VTGLAELAAAYRDRRTTPVEVAERFLAADPVDGPVGAFRVVHADDVRAQARDSAARWAAGTPRGPLDGALVAVKDVLAVDGYDTLGGTRSLAHHGRGDAVAVARLRAAGAVLAGKTHTTELGLSPSGTSAAQPVPRNPHGPDRLPGGSSSGTGAAVAAGLVAAGLGTDGGGSVRIPAALCGVVGLKPSFDLVPRGGGLPIGWWSLDHVGPLARSAADVAAVLDVVAGRHVEVPDRPLRVGVDWTWWGAPDPQVDAACRAVASELGAVEVAVDGVDLAGVAGYVTALSELVAGVWDVLRDRPDALSPDVRAAVAHAPSISGADYVRAQQVRQRLADGFAAVFRRVDVVVVPTTARPAPPRPPDAEMAGGVLDTDLIQALTATTFPANLCGLPAASAPVGVTAPGGGDPPGLPIGLQVVGPRDGDGLVLAAVAALERAGLSACPHPPRMHATLSDQ
jgi:aspartyl-tRNA(Asn)/glutamyl-tRNA(Gln) amidotransferase subunit A